MPPRRIAILAVSLLACACGETTSTGVMTPPAPKPVLSPGPRILNMVGNLGGPNSFAQPCGPLPGSPGVTVVQARVNLELQDGDLIARSLTPADGNLVITFHPDSGDTPTKRVVTTTFSGMAVDYLLGRERISFDTTARSAFAVVSDSTDLAVIGFVYGAVTFSSTTGVTVACDQVFWNLIAFPALDRAP